MARATLRELSRHTWPVATVWDSSDIKEHCHHCRKSHRPALLWTTPGAGCSHSSVPRHGGPCQQALLGARMCLVITSKLSPRSPVSGKQKQKQKNPNIQGPNASGNFPRTPNPPTPGQRLSQIPPTTSHLVTHLSSHILTLLQGSREWNGDPQRYVHLEPVKVNLFGKSRFLPPVQTRPASGSGL